VPYLENLMLSRIEDVLHESHQLLLPIEGYQNAKTMPLEEAIEPLFHIFDRVSLRTKVFIAKERCQQPTDGLSQDESASIMLYTFQSDTNQASLYFVLNETLRMADREKLKPWFSYLKLFITGLSRLLPINNVVYRGVKADLSEEYVVGNNYIWWGVSSCTPSLRVLESDQFCGTISKRTIFIIKCLDGRSIRNHSLYHQENEILLMPGRYFRVHDRYRSGDGLYMIELHEMRPPYELFPLPNSKRWRRTAPGICLEGICTTAACVAYQQEVIIPIGIKRFDVLLDMNASTVQCPMCSNYVGIRKLAFTHCQWRWDGIKQPVPHQKPIKCNKDWSQADDYFMFDDNIQETDTWLQLIVEAKPHPMFTNRNN
jgi:hypothetical protein